MILVDERIGSKHYAELLPGSIVTRLDSGDIAFAGNDVTVGIEIKKVGDALGCMFSSRLADTQLPLMVQQYDVRYLIIEGAYRSEPETGVLQWWKQFETDKPTKCGKWYDAQRGVNRIMYSAFEIWLSTMTEMSDTRLRNTRDADHTAAMILALYTWWQRDDHKSFKVMDETVGVVLSRPTMLRRMIALLPRVGWERSKELAHRCRGVQFVRRDGKPMCAEDWFIEREIAIGTAEKIMEACNGTSR